MTLEARKIRLIMRLRSSGISETAILAAIERVPREHFVPDAFLDQAYENVALPIGHGQTLSQPEVVALMTQALRPERRLKVLEIGTGSGYQGAILAQLCRRLYTIERVRELASIAELRFGELKLRNVTQRVGDGWKGWPEQAPFPRIMVTAAAAEVPMRLVDQLDLGGILVVPIGRASGEQELLRITREEEGFTEERLERVRFVPLVQLPERAGARAAGGMGR
jgi:protein-L-isoaspartate(D-aspartate) O-methyltransferase